MKKIGEVADLLDTTPRALRFYEEEGLLSARRTPGGTRLYSEADVTRFRAILRLAHVGMPLALVRKLATARAKHVTGDEASHDVHAVLADLRAQVREQARSLEQLDAELARAASSVEGCFHCANPPTRQGCPRCPLNRLAGSSEILSLVWEQDLEGTSAAK